MTAVTWNSTFGQFLFRIISRVVLPTNLAKEQKYLNRNPDFDIVWFCNTRTTQGSKMNTD